MPKKQARNAFYFYMKDLEQQLRREGRVFPNGIQDVVPIAHPRWKVLEEKEKERYEKMAKEYKAKMRGRDGDRYKEDNIGNVLALRKDPYTEKEKKKTRERKDVRSKWPPGKELANETFYFINFQTLCETEEGEFLPAEIAVIEYSIKNGITKNLHRFIEPGSIPTGYRYTCIANSENNHKIPVESFELADVNYRGLWIQLENFVNPNQEKEEYPPLYYLHADNSYECVDYCLRWIHSRACLGIPNRLRKVYSLDGLVVDLFSHVGVEVSETSIISMLTSNTWDYEEKTRCEFHEKKECIHCSLGIVNRYGYAISDSICHLFNVNLTEKHVPMKSSVAGVKMLSRSTMPVDPNQEARMPKTKDYLSHPRQKQRPRPQPPKPNSDEEESYPSLRRPNIPAASLGAMFLPQPTLPPSTYANMGAGRGLTFAASDLSGPSRFAGRPEAPEPHSAPLPPPAWQTSNINASENCNSGSANSNLTLGTWMGQGLGRGSILTGASSMVPSSIPSAQPSLASGSIDESQQGRGRGRGILSTVLKGIPDYVPQGRGYAPPGWNEQSQSA
ncbi:hypothetical protein CHS0354_003877 [Potamilus streckersoni]|uniref:HMG box domain-containing protein n=1 Tax=Potamilus streckersoni TaxID=2493646 RepID=A0AAE0WDF5_9BIVA|nr:hypothetical protein CHS0354_003877 [Potamilus streckersoni]